eukprot:TRINITY_DN603_c1_g4_i1.p1 TRINITY_DN603_c1_g4~~TRINITY_DN603_c1_g4_i1.p1  ORF type:complete len:385 (+),score=125.42 TRINITY_DN603_c1_g4_i1:133-1155(+)
MGVMPGEMDPSTAALMHASQQQQMQAQQQGQLPNLTAVEQGEAAGLSTLTSAAYEDSQLMLGAQMAGMPPGAEMAGLDPYDQRLVNEFAAQQAAAAAVAAAGGMPSPDSKPRRKSGKKATKDLSQDGLAQRRLKNRKSAAVSRRRKKEYINNLEQTNTCLTTERLELQLKVATLTNHTWELQLKVEELEKQFADARAERNELAKQRDQLGLPRLMPPSLPLSGMPPGQPGEAPDAAAMGAMLEAMTSQQQQQEAVAAAAAQAEAVAAAQAQAQAQAEAEAEAAATAQAVEALPVAEALPPHAEQQEQQESESGGGALSQEEQEPVGMERVAPATELYAAS